MPLDSNERRSCSLARQLPVSTHCLTVVATCATEVREGGKPRFSGGAIETRALRLDSRDRTSRDPVLTASGAAPRLRTLDAARRSDVSELLGGSVDTFAD